MKIVKNAARLGATLRGLSFGQMATRARHILRRSWWRWRGARFHPRRGGRLRGFVGVWSEIPPERANKSDRLGLEVAEISQEARKVVEGYFHFLGREACFEGNKSWHDPAQSQLWRYHLHYFGYVRALGVSWMLSKNAADWDAFRRLVRAWLSGNRNLKGDGWHPYTLSLRIVNWLHAAAVWREKFECEPDFQAEFQAALHAQISILRGQLEFDVRGNHLLENLRALIWSGVAFEGPEAALWLQQGLSLLEQETAEQILSDGGHFERTPGYHVAVFHVLLEIALLLERNDRQIPQWLRAAIERQAYFLQRMLGPGGRLPLFKDTAYDAKPDPEDLLHVAARVLGIDALRPTREPGSLAYLLLGTNSIEEFAGRPSETSLAGAWMAPKSGFCVARSGGEFLVVDFGKPCPDYLPAHAHADTFSFEFHYFGVPVVVDSGVFEYQQGRWRDYFRSTRAHSTVEVDGENSSDVWSSFRVGRRARPVVKEWQGSASSLFLRAVHDGYRHLPGAPIHERIVRWEAGQFLLILDCVASRKTHVARSFLHLHPVWTPEARGRDWQLNSGAGMLFVHSLGDSEVGCENPSEGKLPQGWYSERFGVRCAKPVLRWTWTTGSGQFRGFVITPHVDLRSCLSTDPDRGLVVRIERSGHSWTVPSISNKESGVP